MKSGHISAPLNPLVITYGGVPAEAVIRSMYYPGQLERRHALDFPLAIAMENAGMSYGLGAVWAGAGAEYSWKGVCNLPEPHPESPEPREGDLQLDGAGRLTHPHEVELAPRGHRQREHRRLRRGAPSDRLHWIS